jgi:hypothetical protein
METGRSSDASPFVEAGLGVLLLDGLAAREELVVDPPAKNPLMSNLVVLVPFSLTERARLEHFAAKSKLMNWISVLWEPM